MEVVFNPLLIKKKSDNMIQNTIFKIHKERLQMKTLKKKLVNYAFGLFLLSPFVSTQMEALSPSGNVNIRIVNFKTCVEQSKMGKEEQATFEALKKQMENVLEEKEKTLNEISTKFNDPDYLDSISPEAETELKRKFRALSQEIAQQQNQYYQALSQTNYKVVQKLMEVVTETAAKIAKKENYDFILNEEGLFFYNPELDISKEVIAKMDELYEKESKNRTPQEQKK